MSSRPGKVNDVAAAACSSFSDALLGRDRPKPDPAGTRALTEVLWADAAPAVIANIRAALAAGSYSDFVIGVGARVGMLPPCPAVRIMQRGRR